MNIEIRKLTPDLADDFFDFFDNRAFSDHAEWSCCYCTSFHSDIKQVDEEVKSLGGGESNLRKVLRALSEKLIKEKSLNGYLAYVDDTPIGWCNAAAKESFRQFDMFDKNREAFIRNGSMSKIKSVMCFVIAPEYRNKGVATSLLERVITDAKAEGFTVVEGYPRKQDERYEWDFIGPIRLYEKTGFVKVAEYDENVVMKKELF